MDAPYHSLAEGFGRKRGTFGFPIGWLVNVFINLMDLVTLGLSHLFITASLHDELARKTATTRRQEGFSAVAWVTKCVLLGNVPVIIAYMACPGLFFGKILLSMEEHLRTLESQAARQEPVIAQLVQGVNAPSSPYIVPDTAEIERLVAVASGRQGSESGADPHVRGGYPADVVNLAIVFPGMRLIANMGLPMLLDGVEIGTLRARSGCEVHMRTGLGAHCLQLKTWLGKQTLPLQFPRAGDYVALLAYSRWSGKFRLASLNGNGRETAGESPFLGRMRGR